MPNAEGHTATQLVNLSLGDRSYDIRIGENLLDEMGSLLKPLLKNNRVFVVSESTVMEYHGDRLKAALQAQDIDAKYFVLNPGEATKSVTQYESLIASLLTAGIDRSDTIVAFGGGVIGDLAGFTAATVLRGINFIQIPTTLLAQVDSSVGGKTGINMPQGKNLVGAFYQPKAVFIDISTLDTLPRRELLAGYAETVKYGLIDDPDFFAWLESNGPSIVDRNTGASGIGARMQAIAHSCRAKARVVAEDEREVGKRALLNLGHTFGHALEAECGYSGILLHGEAVAIGMIMALDASVRLGLAKPDDLIRVTAHLKAVGMKTTAREIGRAMTADAIMVHMTKDKKAEAGTIGFILGGIGTAAVHQGVDLEIIRAVIDDSL